MTKPRRTHSKLTRLRYMRLQRGISIVRAAEYIEKHFTTLSRWELGKGAPDIDSAILLAKLYKCKVEDISGLCPDIRKMAADG